MEDDPRLGGREAFIQSVNVEQGVWERVHTLPPVGLYGAPASIELIIRKLQSVRLQAYTLPPSQRGVEKSKYVEMLLERDKTWASPSFIEMGMANDDRVIKVLISSERDYVLPDDIIWDYQFSEDEVLSSPLSLYDMLDEQGTYDVGQVVNRIITRATSKFSVSIDEKEIAKARERWSLFPCALAMLRRFPNYGKKFEQWMNPLLERFGGLRFEGISYVYASANHDIYATKVGGVMTINPDFSVTAVGERTSLISYSELFAKKLAEDKEYMRANGMSAEASVLGDGVGNPMGGNSPFWVFWDMVYMPAGTFENQRTSPAIPSAAVDYGLKFFSDRLHSLQVEPSHMAYASGGSAYDTIHMSNRAGSAGVFFQNLRKGIANELTKDRKVNKSTVITPTVARHVEWIDLGLPIEGPYWDQLVKDCVSGAHRRSDRAISIAFRVLAKLDPMVAAIMVGRLVIIVSPFITTGQNIVAQPLQRFWGQEYDMGFDVRPPPYTKAKATGMVNKSFQNALIGIHDYLMGLDVTLLGENLNLVHRAGQLRVEVELLPEESDMLFVESDTPLLLSDGWSDQIKESLHPGSSGLYVLPGPTDDPRFDVQECVVHRRVVNMKEYYLKVNMLLDVTAFQMGKYVIQPQPRAVPVPGILPDWYLGAGGRKHGDANTLNGNCIVTLFCLKMGEFIINNIEEFPEFKEYLGSDNPIFAHPGFRVNVADWLIRGDDTLVRIVTSHGTDIHEVSATLLSTTQQLANASKQEGSGRPGLAAAGVSSRFYTNQRPGGFTLDDRFATRSFFKEQGGEFFPELSDDPVEIVAPIETVMSRMLVMREGVLGDQLPNAQESIDIVQDNAPNMMIFEGMDKYSETEYLSTAARRYALRQNRRGYITEDQIPIVETEWLESQMYPRLKARARSLEYEPEYRMPALMDPREGFDLLVQAVKDGKSFEAAYQMVFGPAVD